jgi:hypothetical protein
MLIYIIMPIIILAIVVGLFVIMKNKCKIANCDVLDPNKKCACKTCASGFGANSDMSICKSVNCTDLNCLICNYDNTECSACKTGYEITSGKCEVQAIAQQIDPPVTNTGANHPLTNNGLGGAGGIGSIGGSSFL